MSNLNGIIKDNNKIYVTSYEIANRLKIGNSNVCNILYKYSEWVVRDGIHFQQEDRTRVVHGIIKVRTGFFKSHYEITKDGMYQLSSIPQEEFSKVAKDLYKEMLEAEQK